MTTAQTKTRSTEVSSDALARRKHPRRTFKRGIGILYQGKYEVAEATEIGEGGMSFVTQMEILKGGLLVINVQIPRGSFMVAMAEAKNVTRNEDGTFRVGCQFRKVKFENKREIRAYVSARGE